MSVDGAAALGHTRSGNLDAVRAIAALMVVAAHAYAFSTKTGRVGDGSFVAKALSSGIALFFVLSGFLIAGPFLRALLDGRNPPAAGRYAVRRAARILPAYWVAALAGVALVTSSQLTHWWQVPLHGSLTQTFVLGEPSRLLFVAWTLSIEAMFYVFVPLATFAAWRLARGRQISVDRLAFGVIALGAASVAWLLIIAAAASPSSTAFRHLAWLLPNFLYAFVPGALIYLAETPEARVKGGWWATYRRVKEHPGALAIGAIVLMAIGVAIGDAAHGRFVFAAHNVPLSMGASLGVIAFMGEGPQRRAIARVLAPIGLISYGIYLWHAVVRGALQAHALSWVPGVGGGYFAWPFQIAFLLALTVPLALASWLLLERPLLRRTAAWDRRRRDVRAPREPDLAPGQTTAAPVVA